MKVVCQYGGMEINLPGGVKVDRQEGYRLTEGMEVYRQERWEGLCVLGWRD